MRSRITTVFTVIGAVTVLVLAANTVALAATGSGFILGRSNTASTLTSLTRTTNGVALKVATKSSANAPFSVNGHGKVTNLNADLLDGLDSSVLRTRSYVFRSIFTGKTHVEFSLGLPAGSYLISYSAFLNGVSSAGTPVQCFVEEHIPPSGPRDTAYSAFAGGGLQALALSGSGVVTKTAGGTVIVHCDANGTTFANDSGTPMEIVATPTTIVSLTHPAPARVLR